MFTVAEIIKITGSQSLSHHQETKIRSLFTDSRQILGLVTEGMFIALHGEHFNGNLYVKDAYNKGIRNFIIDEMIDVSAYPNANILLVTDTLVALQRIAKSHREKFNLPVVAITGSNGKTIVKEWLNNILSDSFRIVKSPGSYNSQVGVPLSVLQIKTEHSLGIFEAGISQPGEMERLESVIQPEIGVFTMMGDAHNIGFASEEQKLEEKFKLFKNCKKVVLPYRFINSLLPKQEGFTWSFTESKASVWVYSHEVVNEHLQLKYQYNNQSYSATIPFTDQASLENGVTCLCTCLALGLSPNIIHNKLLQLVPVEMRLSMHRGNFGNVIINDAYNNDLSSLRNALAFMHKQLHGDEKVVVLSDILQSGPDADQIYGAIAQYLVEFGVDRLIGIGSEIEKHVALFNIPCLFFKDTNTFVSGIQQHQPEFRNCLLLLKGARKFEFEKIARALSAQQHTTSLEINLSAIAHNFHQYRKLLNPKTQMMVMVKAFSYGSGSHEIASLLQFHKADYLAVAYADEGVELRRSGVSLPVMVMNIEEKSLSLLNDYQLEPVIYSLNMLKQLQENVKNPIQVHLEFETGMHRLGIEPRDLPAILDFLQIHPQIQVRSVFSHLASAEDPSDDDFTRQQIELFSKLVIMVKSSYPEARAHLLNSPGIARWAPVAQFDMVRLGIGLYGVDPSGVIGKDLKPASTLKSIISQIKHLEPGDGVSYNRRFVATKPMRIATIPIGYADGLNRGLGYGKGHFLIQGKPAKILGTICMDMTMVDVSEIECEEGDEVIVFGGALAVQEVAGQAGTIPYEILSTLSQRIRRVYLQE